ncbi:O-antigen ligase family protein [Candidatus Uhrbacteria bacterium]|nr:O-antigen ligase family protein [Candidatus Uhrbacteria bacterium]
MFAKQFLGKTAAVTFPALAAVHLVAIPLQHNDLPSAVALALVGVAACALTARSLVWGLVLAFAEIIAGGHGHLLAADIAGFPLSLRMAVFAGVMLGYVWHVARRRVRPTFLVFRDTPFLLLAIAVAIGTVHGMLANDPLHAFDDMNGYFTLAYLLPLASVAWDNTTRRALLQGMFASVMWVALSTLAIVFLFTHLPGWMLHDVYAFVRDARIAEVTLLTGPDWFVGNLLPDASPWYFRVFEPAHFFVLVLGLILVAARFLLWKGERMPHMARVAFTLCVAAFIASLSRSFLIGAAAGLCATAVFVGVDAPRAIGRHLLRSLPLLFLVFLGAGVFWATVVFPFPSHPNLQDAAFYRETESDDRDLAVSSRWNLLYPMFTAIMEHPVVGAGFGKEVTFISDDPRVRDINPSGEWTTYRFEWGYQDIWLKMGLLGLVAFVWYLVVLSRAFYFSYLRHGHRWLVTGLYAGVIALFATHVFSPYLNHPIGLGFMLFVLPFFDWQGVVASFAKEDEARAKESVVKVPTPVVTMRGE